MFLLLVLFAASFILGWFIGHFTGMANERATWYKAISGLTHDHH